MEMNDMPYVILGAVVSVRDDSVKTVDDMVKKGREVAESTMAKAKDTAVDNKLETTIKELIEKGKKESEDLVVSIGKVFKDSLDSLGIVTKQDIKSIEDRLSTVEKNLSAKKKAAAKKPAAKKPAAKKPAAKKAAAKKPAAKKTES